MDQRVSIVTLDVADLKRSRKSYERRWRNSTAKAEGVRVSPLGLLPLKSIAGAIRAFGRRHNRCAS